MFFWKKKKKETPRHLPKTWEETMRDSEVDGRVKVLYEINGLRELLERAWPHLVSTPTDYQKTIVQLDSIINSINWYKIQIEKGKQPEPQPEPQPNEFSVDDLLFKNLYAAKQEEERPAPQEETQTAKPEQEPETRPTKLKENEEILIVKHEPGMHSPIPTNTVRCIGGKQEGKFEWKALSLPVSLGRFFVENGYQFWDVSVSDVPQHSYFIFSKEMRYNFVPFSITTKDAKNKEEQQTLKYVRLFDTPKIRELQRKLHMKTWNGQYLTLVDRNTDEEGLLWIRFTYVPPTQPKRVAKTKDNVPKKQEKKPLVCARLNFPIPKGYARVVLQIDRRGETAFVSFSKRVGMLLREKGYVYWAIGMRKEKTKDGDITIPYIVFAKEWDYDFTDVYIFEKGEQFIYRISYKCAVLAIESITQTKLKNGQLLKMTDYHIIDDKLYLRVQPCKDIQTQTI